MGLHGSVTYKAEEMASHSSLTDDFWRVVPDTLDDCGQPMWTCTLCSEGRSYRTRYKGQHEQTALHVSRLQQHEFEKRFPGEDTTTLEREHEARRAMIDDATRQLLAALAGHAGPSNSPAASPTSSPAPSVINWSLFEANEDIMLPLPFEQEVARTVAQALYDRFDSDYEEEERTDSDVEEASQIPEPVFAADHHGEPQGPPLRKRPFQQDDAERLRHWFPWQDKISCTLDVLMHLPRSVFSQRQLDLFLWLLKINDVEDVPSVRSMLRLNAALQRACGIDTIAYKGVLGHNYHVNALDQIISQEMSNPRVRPHLHFYPEETDGEHLSEARQGARWVHELPDQVLTPMLRFDGEDFYIHEPVLLRNEEVCMPVRWFNRIEAGTRVWYAKCWQMEIINTDVGAAWRVLERDRYEVRAEEMLKAFPSFQRDRSLYPHLPSFSKIRDFVDLEGRISSWTLTDPEEGNTWRNRAKGHRVLAFPMWWYCDDTSGNLSKKWNEHNSILMTPAGLPREHSQKEYNIHFLTTSNIAPPLEMMDGVVEQLEAAQKEGIWAWDGQLNEPVLLLPFVLALLGDNPMQSEFACHMGLRAKFFCRNCWCKGRDDTEHTARTREDNDHASVTSDHSVASESNPAGGDGDSEEDGLDRNDVDGPSGSETESAGEARNGKRRGRAKRALESMSDMLSRVTAFIKPGLKRTKAETEEKLRSYFDLASVPDTKTKVAKERTASGIKDTFQQVHLEKLFAACKNVRGHDAKQAALDAAIQELPTQIINPVWRIKELDAHQDTPVEVLHVVLLGFVKYLWRDVVHGQLKNNDVKKELLITRLSSLDVSGLGLSPLAGRTLVQYAGSLTGRDFRAIAQAAPFVLYDMVSSDCYETWIALSKLVPLIWQPEIGAVEPHLETLEKEIKHFLLCAARWSIRWFNKPKFHIILHLVEHIRRFGPAGLFATEAFESFNAVIRAKSVHSNRQAPSRDIARAFAQGNRIRHLLSGGCFQHPDGMHIDARGDSTESPRAAFSFRRCDWRQAGGGPLNLVREPSTITSYLGLDQAWRASNAGKQAGSCTYDKVPRRRIGACLTGQCFPDLVSTYGSREFKSSGRMTLPNGDAGAPGTFVIARTPGRATETFVGRIEEILTEYASQSDLAQEADFILVRMADTSQAVEPYRMPGIKLQAYWHALRPQDLLCTVNVQHNCATQACTNSGTRAVRQERQLTMHTEAAVRHIGDPGDLVLNTGQMRDARFMQPYRIASPSLSMETVLTAAVAQEVDTQKLPARGLPRDMAISGGRARGRGRGRGSRGAGTSRLRGSATAIPQ
ncbi:hypothetical protein OH77DRAFT_1424796, partial [Trametes cingulata]